jgi:hypothetical protein
MTKTTCRDVAGVLAEAGTPGTAHARPVAQHLSQCPKCVAFERQLLVLDEAVRQACQTFEAEPSPDFETRLLQRLGC